MRQSFTLTLALAGIACLVGFMAVLGLRSPANPRAVQLAMFPDHK